MLTKCYFPKRTWKSRLTIQFSVALVVCSCAIVGRAQETETDIVSLLQDAAMHSLAGAHAKAEGCYREALKIIGESNPSSLKTTIALVDAIEKQGNRKDEAARLLLKALETHRAKLGDDHTAIKQMLEKAMNMCNELAWVNSINAEGSPEEYDLGAEFAQYAVDLERNSSWSWLLALAKLRQGDEKASLEVMKRSIAESNEDWLGQWFIMAMVELANGNRQPAVDWYVAASERLAQTYTKWGAILSLQAQAAAQLDYEPAWPVEELPVGKQLESLNRLIADYPPVLQLRATRGLLNVKAKKWDAGTADIQEVVKQLSDRIAQSPDDKSLRTQRGNMYARLGQWKKAAQELEAGLDPESSNSVAWLHVAPVWALSGDKEAHLRFCKHMLERFGESKVNNDIERPIKAFLLVPNSIELSELRIEELERALKGEGVEPWELGWAWGCLGLIEVRRGDPEAALQWIVRAEEQPDYDGTPLEQALCLMVKTLALQDLNRGEKARQAYEQGIELFDADMSSEHDVLIAEILRREAEKRFKE